MLLPPSETTTPLFVLLWTILIILSWVGWGSLVAAALFPRSHRTVDWGLAASWGMSLSVIIGGALNLLTAVTPFVIRTFVLVGAVAWAAHLLDLWKHGKTGTLPQSWVSRAASASAYAALWTFGFLQLVRLLSRANGFNVHDDFHAYLIFPLKMLQAGALTADPFNASQLGSLGGQAFLQAMGVGFYPLSYVKMIDPGACMVVLAALILGYQRRRQAGTWSTVALAALALGAFRVTGGTNLSADLSATTLFVSVYCTLDWLGKLRSEPWLAEATAVALPAAASVALKSTAVPLVGLVTLFGVIALRGGTSARYRTSGVAATVAVLVGLSLLPWMIGMYGSGGTLLFPYLGEGFRGTAYGTFPVWSDYARPSDFLRDPWLFAVGLLGFVQLILLRSAVSEHRLSLALSSGTVAGGLAVLWATAGTSRYTIPYHVGAAMLLAADLARWLEAKVGTEYKGLASVVVHRKSAIFAGVAAVLTATTVVSPVAWGFGLRAFQNVSILGTAEVERARLFDAAAVEARRVQAIIPEGERILVKTVQPFLLDFARNDVFVVDWPHGSSPPPGMPFGEGAELLATYLGDQGIRYIIFEYEPRFGDAVEPGEWWYAGGDPDCRTLETAGPQLDRDNNSGEQAFECAMDIATADFIGSLGELRGTRVALHDDGRTVVLDLARQR